MLAGVDVSGDRLTGNYKFMGLVIGTSESIMAMVDSMGPRPIHMRAIPRDRQDAVFDNLAFDGVACVGLCIRLEKDRILSRITERLRRRGSFLNHKKLSRTYNALLWSVLRNRVDAFLYAHGFEPSRLCIQCDYDCLSFVKDRGLRPENHGPAYELADALAWGNGRGREPSGAVRLDPTGTIEEQMLRRFK